MSRLFIVLTAAGSGTRLGCACPKALVQVGSAPILAHALGHLPASDGVVISAPADCLEAFSRVATAATSDCELAPHESPKTSAAPANATNQFDNASPQVVPGGVSRQASVAAALGAICEVAVPLQDDDLVLVHDAARPFTPAAVFDRVVAALRAGSQAVIPATPVTDTIKVVGTHETVEATLERARLRAVQTPQGFRLKTLLELHERFAARGDQESDAFGDDAGLAEAAGIPVTVVPGSPRSLKITVPFDLEIAKLLLES